jgi:hypothetical protein
MVGKKPRGGEVIYLSFSLFPTPPHFFDKHFFFPPARYFPKVFFPTRPPIRLCGLFLSPPYGALLLTPLGVGQGSCKEVEPFWVGWVGNKNFSGEWWVGNNKLWA